MARPPIALLTDFGLRDHYVAAMKSVILGICPDATLLDISHDIPPQDVLSGAIQLEAVVSYLPVGTVVVAVVDPGVGSSRRGVAIESSGLRFVGPDNGIFSLALHHRPATRVVELTERRYTLESVSRTFEGRDRFAPAAAWLASGTTLDDLGPAVGGLVELDVPRASATPNGVDGAVLVIDHFGNLVTNIHPQDLNTLAAPLTIRVGEVLITGLSGTYAEASPGAFCAVMGSTDRLEIAVNGGSAAGRLSAIRGTSVQVRGRSGA